MMHKLQEDEATALNRFVSLGDNCEFGFFQRSQNIEPGALLRWAITQPVPLINAINVNFEGIYQFSNLEPSADDMVLDKGTGIYFHTKMFSRDKKFLANEDERKEIFRDEKKKIDHLVDKQLRSFTEEKIFIYKSNAGVYFHEAMELGNAISQKGNGILLVATDKGGLEIGSVTHIRKNVYIARIDRFAPYSKADDISVSVWKKIVKTAHKEICF